MNAKQRQDLTEYLIEIRTWRPQMWPLRGRMIIILMLLVLAAGRLGLLSARSGSIVPQPVYGYTLLLLALALLFTSRRFSFTWYGRAIAGIGANVLFVFGVDVGVSAGNLFQVPFVFCDAVRAFANTSVLILWVLAFALFCEAGKRYGE